MIKQRAIDIQSTNISQLGSEMEKKARINASDKETAWNDAGKSIGLLMWRIENFQVKPVPKDQYGRFYSGDSYIILNTYKKAGSDKLFHDVHFWLGDKTSMDEAGTAAYKTVELDDHLNGLPVQHREIQGFESQKFLAYFPIFVVQEGGQDSGFKKVEAEKFRHRLLHVKGTRKRIFVCEVPMTFKSMNSGDVFIADCGLQIYQFNGKSAGPFEKSKAAELCRAIDDERKGVASVKVFEEEGGSLEEWWSAIGGYGPILSAGEGGDDKQVAGVTKLFRISDASGTLEFIHEATSPPQKITKASFKSDDVFLLDTGLEVYVWIGKGSTKTERSKGLLIAEEYLIQENRPRTTPISKVMEGGENEVFESYLL